MFNEVILSREAMVAFARAFIHRAVSEDGVVHAGLVALEVGETGERLVASAGIAGEGLNWSDVFVSNWATAYSVRCEDIASYRIS